MSCVSLKPNPQWSRRSFSCHVRGFSEHVLGDGNFSPGAGIRPEFSAQAEARSLYAAKRGPWSHMETEGDQEMGVEVLVVGARLIAFEWG